MSYLAAKREREQIELYAMDLLWLDIKRHYDNVTSPSDLYYKREKQDNRSKKQIIEDLINGLGGE